jgi:hypothetical protein
MNYPAEYAHVFSVLAPHGLRWSGKEWHCRCPAHHDRRPSLTLRVNGDHLLVKCHGPGCSFREIQTALSARAGKRLYFGPWNGERDRNRLRRQRRERKLMIECVYPYCDESGEILFEVCRGRDQEGKRQFWQRVPDSTMPGGYRLTLDGTRRVLFNLPDLHANAQLLPEKRRTVVIVEGEKDSLNLSEIGVLATTTSGGAGKAHLTDLRILHGRRIAVIPDHDPINERGRRPGWDHAMALCDLLYGKVISLKVVTLGLPEGSDVTDWLTGLPASMTAAERKAALADLVRKTPEYNPLCHNVPVPPFTRDQLTTLAAVRKEVAPTFKSAAEVVGTLEAAVHGLVSALGDAKAQGLTPDPDMLLRRLLDMAATCQRSAEDLKLICPLDGNGRSQ